ncbi:hypothetical protein ACJU26_04805 [Acidithiobacillus sp. M4-SHS-6]|uniref:hypothetical protein n=1 Tax=Acidithiobacillus sp. M4-SHS-6 TaxID=3383024 RepID=UPI0039BEA583
MRSREPYQPDMLADITKLSQFPRHKQRQPGKFDGPHNERERRALQALLRRHITREELDAVAGASNGPELTNRLRERGLELPCYRLGTFDRDGLWVWRGLYALTQKDRVQVSRALAVKGGPAATQGTASRKATKQGGRHG